MDDLGSATKGYLRTTVVHHIEGDLRDLRGIFGSFRRLLLGGRLPDPGCLRARRIPTVAVLLVVLELLGLLKSGINRLSRLYGPG